MNKSGVSLWKVRSPNHLGNFTQPRSGDSAMDLVELFVRESIRSAQLKALAMWFKSAMSILNRILHLLKTKIDEDSELQYL